MFVNAIKKVADFTRPIHTISRNYGSDIVTPGAATLFFVNEDGVAVTCKHVAEMLIQAEQANKSWVAYKKEKDLIQPNEKYNRKVRELAGKYGYNKNITMQIKNLFVGCVDNIIPFDIIAHPLFDVAIIKFSGYSKIAYKGHAVLLKDEVQIQQGKFLCRLGFPFPEFSNFVLNKETDDIEWTNSGNQNSPRFPIDGMVTRHLLDSNGKTFGIEMSTPGLRGQSGGPLFDTEGKIYGMQAATSHLHLGFDIKEMNIIENGQTKKVSDHPFLHLGDCIHVGVIKQFLKDNGIKYYEE